MRTHLETRRVRTNELLDLVALLEGSERGHLEHGVRAIQLSGLFTQLNMGGSTHGTHADLLGDLCRIVDVDLVEVHAAELLRQLLKDGRDDPARATPGRPEVEHSGAVPFDLYIAHAHAPREYAKEGWK